MKTLDFSKPVTFKVAEKILEKQNFTQLELSKDLSVSVGQVNKVTKFLEENGAVIKTKKGFHLEKPLILLEKISFFRKMNSLKIGSIMVSNKVSDIFNGLNFKPTACLETALNLHGDFTLSKRSNYYVKNKLEATYMVEKLEEFKGTDCEINFFLNDISFEPIDLFGVKATPFSRTLIDLSCDNSIFIAGNLIENKWQKNIL